MNGLKSSKQKHVCESGVSVDLREGGIDSQDSETVTSSVTTPSASAEVQWWPFHKSKCQRQANTNQQTNFMAAPKFDRSDKQSEP